MKPMIVKEKTSVATLLIIALICIVGVNPTEATTCDILLDADTPATGSLLGIQALVTPFGTISFDGEIRDRNDDHEFNAAGASGDVFDIHDSPIQAADLSFDFDILSATFIYGGNEGSILVEARDASDALVDSFFQADTYGGEPAGPVTLSGSGIRRLHWEDTVPAMNFAPLDNICITVPEPATVLLLALGGLALIPRRRR